MARTKPANGAIGPVVEPLDLDADEMKALRTACQENWAAVRPLIFRTLFEQSLDKPERHAYGAHFTSEADIQRVDDNFQTTNAVTAEWPAFNACIGNPPYLGAKRILERKPAEEIAELQTTYPEIRGFADYVVCWSGGPTTSCRSAAVPI